MSWLFGEGKERFEENRYPTGDNLRSVPDLPSDDAAQTQEMLANEADEAPQSVSSCPQCPILLTITPPLLPPCIPSL